MKFGWRVILIIAVVIVVVGLIFIGFKKPNNQPAEQAFTGQNLNTTPLAAEKLPIATGNIDDAVNSLIQDSNSEILSISSDSTDSSVVTYDNSEISNFGQSYENNF